MFETHTRTEGSSQETETGTEPSRMSRRRLLQVGVAAGVASVAGCSSLTGDDLDLTDLSFASASPEAFPTGQFAVDFADRLESKSNSDITIEFFLGGELGGSAELPPQVSDGDIDFALAQLDPVYEPGWVLNFPGTFDSYEHMIRATNPRTSPVIQEINEEMAEDANVRMLCQPPFGTNQVCLTGEPASHPDDMEGRTLRSADYSVWEEMVRGMGASAEPMAISELPTALETGTVSGFETPETVLWIFELYPLVDHLVMTNHFRASVKLMINRDLWDDLSDEQQTWVQDAALEANENQPDRVRAVEDEAIDGIADAGVQVLTEDDGVDVEAFNEAISEHLEEVFLQDDQTGAERISQLKDL